MFRIWKIELIECYACPFLLDLISFHCFQFFNIALCHFGVGVWDSQIAHTLFVCMILLNELHEWR